MASEKIRRLAASKKDLAASGMGGPISMARLVEIENSFVEKLEEKQACQARCLHVYIYIQIYI